MIISFSRNFIFLKTRKTAGTSTEIVLRDLCNDEDILTPLRPEESQFTTRGAQNNKFPFSSWPIQEKLRWLFGNRSLSNRPECAFANHTPAGEIARRYPAEFASFLKIGCIRNPFDQQVSLYFWRTRNLEEPPSFEEWMHANPPPYLNNWEIITKDGTLVLDVVVRFETIENDLRSLGCHFGVQLRALPDAKAGMRKGRDYRPFYSSTSRTLVESWYRNELDVFGYSF
jgi:Sulfotransferase family